MKKCCWAQKWKKESDNASDSPNLKAAQPEDGQHVHI